MQYSLGTSRETYIVTQSGSIGRPSIKMSPSNQWKLLGFVRFNNFGNVVERVSIEEALVKFPNTGDWSYKNGRAKWHVMDLDHGTRRIWGNEVIRWFCKG